MTLFKSSSKDNSDKSKEQPTTETKEVAESITSSEPDNLKSWSKDDPFSNETDVSKLPDDHPVHKISPEKQEKMRKKGVNPVLKAEMDASTNNGFMSRWGKTSMGPWYT